MYFSKRFAAKEAFVKALGTGFRDNINQPLNREKTFSILIGDSFIEGVGLNYENTIGGIIENKAKIKVLKNSVEHWLNGVKILEYVYQSNAMWELVDKSKFKDMPYFGKSTTGHIGLQHHGEEVWYRNIRIRKL